MGMWWKMILSMSRRRRRWRWRLLRRLRRRRGGDGDGGGRHVEGGWGNGRRRGGGRGGLWGGGGMWSAGGEGGNPERPARDAPHDALWLGAEFPRHTGVRSAERHFATLPGTYGPTRGMALGRAVTAGRLSGGVVGYGSDQTSGRRGGGGAFRGELVSGRRGGVGVFLSHRLGGCEGARRRSPSCDLCVIVLRAVRDEASWYCQVPSESVYYICMFTRRGCRRRPKHVSPWHQRSPTVSVRIEQHNPLPAKKTRKNKCTPRRDQVCLKHPPTPLSPGRHSATLAVQSLCGLVHDLHGLLVRLGSFLRVHYHPQLLVYSLGQFVAGAALDAPHCLLHPPVRVNDKLNLLHLAAAAAAAAASAATTRRRRPAAAAATTRHLHARPADGRGGT